MYRKIYILKYNKIIKLPSISHHVGAPRGHQKTHLSHKLPIILYIAKQNPQF